MAVPKKKTSKMKRDQRRSHHALRMPGMSECPNCGDWMMPHRACPSCGHYRGREVISVES
ncbi:MAG: 50S ribosomal protein L32 [Zetaproteobacteria bacterium]|nr:MAG: 50S ribosomal protein L32 [Zetaproteobacteria bacterium]